MNVSQLNKFHQTRPGQLLFGLVELGLAYLIGLFAENSGSLWEWTLTLVLLLGAAQNFVRFLGIFVHGRKH